MTYVAPAWMCALRSSRLVNAPVHSKTMWTSNDFHGRRAGCGSRNSASRCPPTMRPPSSVASTRLVITTVDSVVFQEVRDVVGRADVVRRDQLQAGRVHHDLERGAPYSSKSIDTDSCHDLSPAFARPRATMYCVSHCAERGRSRAEAGLVPMHHRPGHAMLKIPGTGPPSSAGAGGCAALHWIHQP